MLIGDNKNLQTLPGVVTSFLLEQLDVKHLQAAILRVKMLALEHGLKLVLQVS